MGYYTSYSISVYTGEHKVPTCLHKNSEDAIFCSQCGVRIGSIDIEDQLEDLVTEHIGDYGNPFEDSCKWYGHDDDMKSFSLRYPNVVFKLEGEGEESGDIWVAYYKNGKVQECKARIEFDEYDETKLV